jgi:hypothetical protein
VIGTHLTIVGVASNAIFSITTTGPVLTCWSGYWWRSWHQYTIENSMSCWSVLAGIGNCPPGRKRSNGFGKRQWIHLSQSLSMIDTDQIQIVGCAPARTFWQADSSSASTSCRLWNLYCRIFSWRLIAIRQHHSGLTRHWFHSKTIPYHRQILYYFNQFTAGCDAWHLRWIFEFTENVMGAWQKQKFTIWMSVFDVLPMIRQL